MTRGDFMRNSKIDHALVESIRNELGGMGYDRNMAITLEDGGYKVRAVLMFPGSLPPPVFMPVS
jgi:hypothetical protein